jgi:hypothetical protein
MDWLIYRSYESGTSGEQRSLEGDIQKSVVGTDALVERGRKVKGGDRAFVWFFVFRRECREGVLGVFEIQRLWQNSVRVFGEVIRSQDGSKDRGELNQSCAICGCVVGAEP